MRMSKMAKKILLVILCKKPPRVGRYSFGEWWSPIQLAYYVKPSAVGRSLKHLYDSSIYRCLSGLVRDGYLEKDRRIGPYQGCYVFRLTEKGRDKATSLREEITTFIKEWEPLIRDHTSFLGP